MRDATDSHVFGIEVDNDITGRYESFLDPEEKLAAIRELAKQAHAAGNRAFVYIAGTECITKDADKTPHTPGQGSSGLASAQAHGRARLVHERRGLLDRQGRRGCLDLALRQGLARAVHAARAPDRGHGHRRHLRGHSLLDDALRRLGGLLGELRRLHRGGLPPEDRPRRPPRPEARRFRGSAFPPVGRFPHRDHHRVHARDRPERQVGQPEHHDHPRDLSRHRARSGGGRRGRLRAVRRDRCHRPRVRVRRRRPHGDVAHAARLVPLPGGHALLPRLRRGQGHLDPQLLLGRGHEHRSAGADDEPRHVPGDGGGEFLGRGHPRDVRVQRPAHPEAHLRVDRKAREDALPAARTHPSDRRVLLAGDAELLSGRVPALLPGHPDPAAAEASGVPGRDAANAGGVSWLDADTPRRANAWRR